MVRETGRGSYGSPTWSMSAVLLLTSCALAGCPTWVPGEVILSPHYSQIGKSGTRTLVRKVELCQKTYLGLITRGDASYDLAMTYLPPSTPEQRLAFLTVDQRVTSYLFLLNETCFVFKGHYIVRGSTRALEGGEQPPDPSANQTALEKRADKIARKAQQKATQEDEPASAEGGGEGHEPANPSEMSPPAREPSAGEEADSSTEARDESSPPAQVSPAKDSEAPAQPSTYMRLERLEGQWVEITTEREIVMVGKLISITPQEFSLRLEDGSETVGSISQISRLREIAPEETPEGNKLFFHDRPTFVESVRELSKWTGKTIVARSEAGHTERGKLMKRRGNQVFIKRENGTIAAVMLHETEWIILVEE